MKINWWIVFMICYVIVLSLGWWSYIRTLSPGGV